MLTRIANGDSRLSLWLRVREYAVPPSMIETATARRRTGDWSGACAAARIDVDVDLRAVARTHGRDLAARVRTDLRHLAPDLLRWHMPRTAPDGLLRPGLTVALARYDPPGDGGPPVHLVARTVPAWADAGQRIGLALWDASRTEDRTGARRHPHPHPDRRFRLDLHRHLWDARRTQELRARAGADRPPTDPTDPTGPTDPDSPAVPTVLTLPGGPDTAAFGPHCAVDRWAAEAAVLLRAEGRSAGRVAVRLGAGRRLVLDATADATATAAELRSGRGGGGGDGLVLPDAATWVPPDLALLRAGLIDPDRLHPLVAAALAPDRSQAGPSPVPDGPGRPHVVECRGARHRIDLVDGVLVPLDHDPEEVRREELLAALTGTPLPCLRIIDEAHRTPDCLDGVRERLNHGDTAGALALVEALLGRDAVLRDGALRDELAAAARRRVTYGLFRAGLAGPAPTWGRPRRGGRRAARPRRTTSG